MTDLERKQQQSGAVKPVVTGAVGGAALTASLFILGPLFTLLVLLGAGAFALWQLLK